MKITSPIGDDAVLKELGLRLARQRLDLEMTQKELANKAGIAKRTLERVEQGHSAQISTLIRILRVLGSLDRLDVLVPEVGIRPMELLRLKGKQRQRAPGRRKQLPGERT